MTEYALVQRIVWMCLRINELGYHHAFCEFSGHVNWLSVKVTENPDYTKRLVDFAGEYVYEEEGLTHIIKALEPYIENYE